MFYGNCTEDHFQTYMEGTCSGEYDLNSKSVETATSTYDTTNISHYKKRRLSGNARLKAYKKLQYAKALTYRKEKIIEKMKFKGREPPNLQSTVIDRKARQNAVDLYIGFKSPKDVL